ncbi:MAG: hypothetical protein C4344_00085 [Acidimicrobiia bacterium]
MVIVVDPSAGRVELADPDDCGRFHVEVRGEAALEALDHALRSLRAGRLEGEAAVIEVAGPVVAWGRGRVGPGWPEAFGRMLVFAESRGWLDPAGIRAHVEWGTAGMH